MKRQVYELLAAVLDYPNPELPAAVSCLVELLPEDSPQAAAAFIAFQDKLQSEGIAGLQEWYIRTFDFRADCSLYIGHHLFGESGRRGVFIAELIDRYRERQLSPAGDLPDHISCLLRYLATLDPGEEASELIHACLIPAIARINAAKTIEASPYRTVLTVLPAILQQSENGCIPSGELAWIPSSLSHFPILP